MRQISVRLLALCGLLIFATSAIAETSFVRLQLARGTSLELPKNWTALSSNQKITLATAVESQFAATAASELSFAANYYDDANTVAALVNVRYYPTMDIKQSEVRRATAADVREFDQTLRAELEPGMKRLGLAVLKWNGTEARTINGTFAFVTSYDRQRQGDTDVFHVRLVRVLNGSNSFTLTVSYRDRGGVLYRPITDRIISSLKAG